MNLEELINLLDEEILDGWSLPISNGKCVVDREKIKDLIQEIRLNLPAEIRQAKAVVADRNEILRRAQDEADDIVQKAQEKAQKLCGEQEVVKLANAKASEIVAAAQNRSKEIRLSTANYSETVLEAMEEMLTKSILEVKQTRQQVKNAIKN